MTGAHLRSLAVDAPVAAAIALGVATHLHLMPEAAGVVRMMLLVALILACAFRAMKRADELAEHFGEPRAGVLPIGFLRTERAGGDDDFPLLRPTAPRQELQPGIDFRVEA